MAAPHTHSKQIQAWAAEYLDDVKDRLLPPLGQLKTSIGFKEVYQISLAFDAVLVELGSAGWNPAIDSHRSIVLRIPLLVAMGQSSAATIELRRLIELAVWTIYFKDHPVEWAHFATNATDGYHPSIEQPIRYCAHRGSKFYLDYIDELLNDEPSGIAKEAVEQIRRLLGILNATVHPGQLALAGGQSPPFETISETSLKIFSKVWRDVGSSLAIVLASVYRPQFNLLQPVHRGHFNWLVGKKLTKRLLSGPFGLP